MEELKRIYKNLPDLLRYSFYLTSLNNFTWTFLFVVTEKLQGLLFSVSLISFFMFLSKVSNLFIIYFKNVDSKIIYFYFIVLNLLYLFVSMCFYIDKYLFMIVESFFGVIYIFLGIIYYYNFQKLVAEEYSPTVLQDYQYITDYGKNISMGLSLIITFFINDVDIIFGIFVPMLLIYLIFQIKFYKFWVSMDTKTVNT